MKDVARYESLFRQVTPLFLLGLLLVVLCEPILPYRDWLHATFGADVVLKVAVLFLIAYVLLLWGESLRLHGLLTGILEAFKSFERQQGSESSAGAGAQRKGAANPQARLEAAKLLIAAMDSPDESIRETSHHNLVRLVGQDLGKDPKPWREWLAEQST